MKASVMILGILSLFFSGCMSSSINNKAETKTTFSSYDYFNVVHKSALKRGSHTAIKNDLQGNRRIESMIAWIDLSRE